MTTIQLTFCLLLFLSLPFTTLSSRSLTSNSNPCDPTTRPDPRSLRPDKLTVLINGYSEHRIPTLRAIASAYSASPLVAAVVILWGNPSTPVQTLADLSRNLSLLYSAGAPVTVLPQQSDSLNLRFLPRRWIRTRGILICDDDVEVDPTSVEFAFKLWQLNQDRLIGLFARSHGLDLERRNWIYTVHPDRYSIILTKFMLLNIDYLYLYSCGAQGLENKLSEMRGVVDNMHNCEDILMNFVVADVSKRGPILIGVERVRDWGDARNEVALGEGRIEEGLSGTKRGRGEHRKRRGECIREFHKILEKMPLRYNYGKVIRSISEQGLCEKRGKLVPCDQQIE